MLAFPRRCIFLALIVLAAIGSPALGQNAAARKLPSAEKIVADYLKAIGGKKAAVAQRDATYEYTVYFNNQPFGAARTLRKAPTSERFELTFGNGQIISAATARSAWELGFDKQLRTLTSLEAATAKLQATLAASHLVDIKKANVLARVMSLGDLATEPAYIVEFSTRSGARVQYYFSVKSKLITKITSDTPKTRLVFEDYRPEHGLLEPHRVRMLLQGQRDLTPASNVTSTSYGAPNNGAPSSVPPTGNVTSTSKSTATTSQAPTGELTLTLQSITQNTGIDNALFDPPADTESLDITALLREVARNQDATEQRVTEYSFKQTETDRTINSKGEVKKESVKVYEVFPLPNREPVQKLISENGVPLSAERAAKEDKRVQEEFLKAERDKDKDAQEAARRRAEREQKSDEGGDPAISMFLRACDFVSPRRERFAGRESIVFDFRPRAGFKPKTREESLVAKLVGVVWIDPIDKQVMRLEARLAEGFKMAGGLVVSLKPGAALVMEQTRMAEGVWLPRFAQINLSVKVLLFAGGDFNKTIEWSDYRHFSGDVKDYKIEAPPGVKP